MTNILRHKYIRIPDENLFSIINTYIFMIKIFVANILKKIKNLKNLKIIDY